MKGLPMLTGEFFVETKASASGAHAYLADLSHHAEWRADVMSCDIESGQAGQDGTIYRQHVRQGPGTAWRRVQAHIIPRSEVGFETLGGVIRACGTSRILEYPGGGSFIRCTILVSFHGPGYALRPIVARELSRRVISYPKALRPRLDAINGM
jgi:hypothetical protein